MGVGMRPRYGSRNLQTDRVNCVCDAIGVTGFAIEARGQTHRGQAHRFSRAPLRAFGMPIAVQEPIDLQGFSYQYPSACSVVPPNVGDCKLSHLSCNTRNPVYSKS
jgi:hypothetical protein